MSEERNLTPAAIKYLLAIAGLCRGGNGARCVDVAEKMNVSKPGAHSMIQSLCQAGLAEKEKYGIVYLTREGKEAAELYGTCYELLYQRMQSALGLEEDACRNAVCAVMAQMPGQLRQLTEKLA